MEYLELYLLFGLLITICNCFVIEYEINLMVPNILEDTAIKVLNIANEQLSLSSYCNFSTSYDCGSHHEYYIHRFFPQVTYKFKLNDINVTNSIAIIGSLYSSDSISISKNIATPNQKPMISYGSTATELSSSTEHKFFSRLLPSNDLQTNAMLDLCYRFNWRKQLALIGTLGAYGESGVLSMKYYADLYKIQIDYEGLVDSSNISIALQDLKTKNCHYILAFITDDIIKDFLIAANNLQMLQGDYIFIFSDSSIDALNIVDSNISFIHGTPSENQLLEGIFIIESTGGFWRRDSFLKEKWEIYYPNTEYPSISPNIYDSFLALALGVDVLLLNNLNTEDVFNGTLLQHEFRSVEFLGTSGRILFNKETGDRITAPYTLMNVNSNLKVNHVTRWELGRKFDLIVKNFNLPGGKTLTINLESSVVEVIGRSGQFYPIPDSSTTPSPRYGASLSIHSAESELVIFGGRDQIESRYNDLWIYDIKQSLWRQVFSFKTPEPRSEHISFIWKNQANEYYYSIFGGYNGIAILQEQWNYQFSINSWIEHEHSIVPNPRLRSKAITYNETTYLVGGEGILSDYNDVWGFSHNRGEWEQINVKNSHYVFQSRHDHCLCATNGSLFVWAGRSLIQTAGMDDTYLFNIENKLWSRINPLNVPLIRYSPVCEAYNGIVYMGLGYSYHPSAPKRPFNDFYKLDLNPIDGVYKFVKISKQPPNDWEGRYHISSVKFNGYMLLFSGWGQYSILNDFYRLSFENEALEIVHPYQVTPPNLYDFEYVTIGNSLFVFGGYEFKSTISLTNNFFKLDLNNLTWSSLFPSGKQPPPLSGHATISYSDIIMVHGGLSSSGFLNNLWLYSVIDNSWNEKNFENFEKIPSSRAFHTAEIYLEGDTEKHKVYFFGGLLKDKMLEDIWMYSIDDLTFKEIIVKQNGISPKSLVHMKSSNLKSEQIILLYGGQDFAVIPNKYVYSFDPKNQQYDIFALIPDEYQTSRSRIVASEDKLYIHGGSFIDEISDLLLEVKRNSVKKIDISSSAIKPERRSDHGIIIFGQRLIIFGGVGAVPSKKMQSDITVYNNLFEYRLGPICLEGNKTDNCHLCSPGTYHILDRCISCPQGYYSEKYGQTECKPCPPGFYGVLPGSSSSKLCFPCPPNSWQDNSGSSSCKVCNPEKDYCPIGSSKKLNREIGRNKDNYYKELSEQPLDWQDKSVLVNKALYISIYVCSSVIGLILFLFFIGFYWLRKCIFMLDFLFNEKHNYRIGEMKRKKTNPGGILTIIFVLIWITACFNIIYPYKINNTKDEKTLTPKLIDLEPISYLVASINFTGPQNFKCTNDIIENTWTTCHPSLDVEQVNIEFNSKDYKCMKTIHPEDGVYCHIRVIYNNLKLISSVGDISIGINEPSSFASFIGWNLSTSSSYPLENNREPKLSKELNIPDTIFSHVEGLRYCNQYNLFRGKQDPTSMSFKYIPTFFKKGEEVSVGAHIQNIQFSFGSLVESNTFSSQNGFSFEFILFMGENTLNIERSQRKSNLVLISEIGGTTSALFSLLVIVLRIYESCQTLVLNSRFVKKSSFLQKLILFKKPRDLFEILDRIKAKKDRENNRKVKVFKNEDEIFIIDETELKENLLDKSYV